MLTANTIKKIERAGGIRVQHAHGEGNNSHAFKFGSWRVEFHDQQGDVICLRARRVTDLDESLSDYSAGSWFDSVTKCIEFAKRMAHEDANCINRVPGFVCPV